MEEFEEIYFPDLYKKRFVNFQEENKNKVGYTLAKLSLKEVLEKN